MVLILFAPDTNVESERKFIAIEEDLFRVNNGTVKIQGRNAA